MKLFIAGYEAYSRSECSYGQPQFYVVASSLVEAAAKADVFHKDNPSIVKKIVSILETTSMVKI